MVGGELLHYVSLLLESVNLVCWQASSRSGQTDGSCPPLVFVHPSVHNELAQHFGSSSLRSVILSDQVDQQVVPCPPARSVVEPLLAKSLSPDFLITDLLEVADAAGIKHPSKHAITVLLPCRRSPFPCHVGRKRTSIEVPYAEKSSFSPRPCASVLHSRYGPGH